MKRRSKPVSAYERRTQPDRLAWAADWLRKHGRKCMRCGGEGDFRGLQIHEIARRSHARLKWAERCNYLLVCGRCHEGPIASMPHARQLAIKQRMDPEHYGLAAWVRLYGTGPECVTQGDVDGWGN